MDFTFVSAAFAQGAEQAAQKAPSLVELLVMPVGFLMILYFFIIRPQQKKAKEQTDLLSALKPGDEVVTSGGIIGRIRSVADGFVTLDIAPNTAVKVLKGNIGGLTKTILKEPEKAK